MTGMIRDESKGPPEGEAGDLFFPRVTLIPLEAGLHAGLLQAVYAAAPAYWALHQLAGAPEGQAAHDLEEAAETPGRTLLGILLPDAVGEPAAGEPGSATMVGMLDVRLHYPQDGVATLGLAVVAEPHQRQRVAAAAWRLLEGWLREQAGMHTARLAVEQFNTGALRFFTQAGFVMTGEAKRTRVGDTFVRLLYMEKAI